MLKRIAPVFAVLILCSCISIGNSGSGEAASVSSEEINVDMDYWITPPKSNELVVIGVSGLQTKREAEITNAREDAARKVSMYYGVQADTASVQSIGSNFLAVFADSEITVEYDRQTDQYIDQLNFDPDRDVFIRKNAVFIRFTYPAAFPGNINYTFGKNSNGSPKWTTSPPHEIGGFMAGVGFSRRQERIRDTLIKSSESAVASIISRLSSSVDAGEVSTFTQGASYVRHQSSGRLTNFTVLEIWIDPATENVWTLAVAQSAQ